MVRKVSGNSNTALTDLMDFKKDILISYAHIDDESLMEGQKGWISEFHRSLEVRLSQLMGARPVIWRDPKLQGNDFFGEEIVDQFPEVALLISILSPRYVRSEWCTKEVGEFIKAAQENGGFKLRNKSRIFKVIKTPIPLEDHPEAIRETLGYEFFKLDPETGRPKEFGKIYGPEAELAYWEKLDDLAHDITDLLNQLQKMGPQVGGDVALNDDAVAVYLAQTSYDLREYRDNIKRELQEHGYRVLPDQHLPLIAPDFISESAQLMDQCEVAIHLIGENYGIIPEGSQKSVVELQNETAAQKSKEGKLKRLIWFSPHTETEDERQINFVEHLKTSELMHEGADLFENSLEDLKYAIHDQLAALKKEEQKEEEKVEEGDDLPPQIYLLCDQKDLDDVIPLEDYLFEQGYDVILPVFEGDEQQVRIDHQENLKACDAVIIYYGAGNELWMRSKTRDLMKIAGYGRKKPLNTKAVYLAPPMNPRKERFRAQGMTAINGSDGFAPELMQPFTEKL